MTFAIWQNKRKVLMKPQNKEHNMSQFEVRHNMSQFEVRGKYPPCGKKMWPLQAPFQAAARFEIIIYTSGHCELFWLL